MNDRGLPPNLNLFDLEGVDDFLQELTKVSKPRYPLPLVLPCANVEPKLYHACSNPGTMACSACKLVSYCSKVRHFVDRLVVVLLPQPCMCRIARRPTGTGIRKVPLSVYLPCCIQSVAIVRLQERTTFHELAA